MILTIALTCMAKEEATRMVTGKVTTLGGIACANIRIEAAKSNNSCRSDSTGHFVIECNSSDKLIFSGKPFMSKKVKVTASDTISLNIELAFQYNNDNLELAIGYGYISEADRTEAIEQVRLRHGFCSYTDIYDIFRGRFAGVTVIDGEIIIRGKNSIYGDCGALVLLDGVPVEGDLSFINPCDIESIEVIKDGTASIYGSRGANGAVLIQLTKPQQIP